MSAIEDELMRQAAEDAEEVAYIRSYLPQELKEKFTDDELYYFLDVIIEYYTENDVFYQTPDADGFVEIDLEKVVDYVVKKAKKEQMGEFDPEDIFFVVQADLDYNEDIDDDEE